MFTMLLKWLAGGLKWSVLLYLLLLAYSIYLWWDYGVWDFSAASHEKGKDHNQTLHLIPTSRSASEGKVLFKNTTMEDLQRSVHLGDTSVDNSYLTAVKTFPSKVAFKSVCEYHRRAQKSNDSLKKSWNTVQQSVLDTSNLMDIPTPPYLPSYRNPCFHLRSARGQVRLSCLPYFFVAGFPKCGTTDFYNKFKLHPLIATPKNKEPLYFSLGLTSSSNKRKRFTNYLSCFSQASVEVERTTDTTDEQVHPKLIGDFSTRELLMEFNTWKPNKSMTYDLIKHLLPCSKFIVLIRDPVERLYSDFIYFLKRQTELISAKAFHDHVMKSLQWWKNCTQVLDIKQCLYGNPQLQGLDPLFQGDIYQCWLPQHICPNFRIGFYSYILQDWMEHFGKDSFFILAMENFSKDPVAVLQNKVLPFLGLPAMNDVLVKAIQNMNRSYPFDSGPSGNVRKTFEEKDIVTPMLPETREALEELYRDSNSKLRQL